MIISIASGKGGTGKTTVATNMATVLGARARLLDCDVEEPNAHLFLQPVIEHSQRADTPVPEIDFNLCDYCKKCAEICRFKALAVFGENAMVFPELCHSCGGCTAVCPTGAISDASRELGVVETGRAGELAFVQGCLRVGEAMSPPLIKQVKAHAQPDRINIIDAPPGTSCPVIEAMNHTDFVLMVTEPTPFGLHDLTLAVEAVRLLDIPHGLVINRSDIGDQCVQDYADQQGLPVLMEIPFDRRIAEAYSRGQMIVDAIPEWAERFLGLYERIETMTNERGGR